MRNSPGQKAFHGGAFYETIGTKFDNLSKIEECINADVLDAWFDPSPKVIAKLQDHLPWILRTSPPTHCEGLTEVLAEDLSVSVSNLLTGAGSSSLIFLAMRQLLNAKSRVLILDPTYGEYKHVFEEVIGCECVRLPLDYVDGYSLSIQTLGATISRGRFDLVVLVNPNSPTGTFINKAQLQILHDAMPKETLLWIDEAYIDYVDKEQSMGQTAASSSNIIVCKSLSKIYALSGARSAYLLSNADIINKVERFSPPWPVSLPAQIATIAAIHDYKYYQGKYCETNEHRKSLTEGLRGLGFKVHESVANFLLVEIPPYSCDARMFVKRCKEFGLYIRDVSSMGENISRYMIRVAVKDAATNQKIETYMSMALGGQSMQGERK